MISEVKKKCARLIICNGWEWETEITKDEEIIHFRKKNNISIDFFTDEIVFITNQDDFLCIPIDYYAFLNVLIAYNILLYYSD